MRRSNFFHPIFVLVCAVVGILTYVALVRWRFQGGDLSNHFFYTLPIIVPFVAFLFDRAARFWEAGWFELAIDGAVVVISILRAMGVVPFVSGHVLFLTYAIARPGSRLTRITALIVLLQVFYLKLFVWHDPVTPVTGIMLGLFAAFVVRRFSLPLVNARPLGVGVSTASGSDRV
jgi:hypothetical protein